MIRSYLFAILFFTSALAIAQSERVDPKFIKAKTAYANKQYKNASIQLNAIIADKFEARNGEAISMLADCYWNMRSYKQAKFYYEKLAQLGTVLSEIEQFRMSEVYAMFGDYARASASLAGLPNYKSKMLGYQQLNHYLQDSLDYSVQYLNVNTSSNKEFSPSIINNSFTWVSNVPNQRNPSKISAIDGASLFLIRRVADTSLIKGVAMTSEKETEITGKSSAKNLALSFEGSDKYLLTRLPRSSTKGDNKTTIQGMPILGASVNRYFNVSNIVYAPALNKYFLTVNHKKEVSKKDKTKTLFIAQADLVDGVLQNIQKINLGVDSYSYMHPAVDPTGKYLIFSSNLDATNNYDLYYSTKDSSGWSQPIKLVGVNTNGDEVFPSFSATGDLFFSSNGRPGLGGLDIYKVNAPFASANLKVQSLTYPINSKNDDFGFGATQNPNYFYFSSDRLGTDDIYSASFNEVIYTVTGKVSFTSDASLIPSTKLYLKRRGEAGFIDSAVTSNNSTYNFKLRPNREYDIYIDYFGKMKLIDSVNTQTIRSSVTKNIGIIGQSIVQFTDSVTKLNNLFLAYLQKRAADSLKALAIPNEFRVHYAFNKFALDKKDIYVLDSLVEVLANNPTLQVSIGSFTDCKGNLAYNKKLSLKRSNAVVAYLKKRGVPKSKIISSHYGKAYFVMDCGNAKYNKASQVVNRRSELLVTEQKNTTWDVLHKTINAKSHKVLSSLAVTELMPKKLAKVKKQITDSVKIKPVVVKAKPIVVVKPKADTVKAKPVVVVKPKADTVKAKPVVVVKPKVDTVKSKPVVVVKPKVDTVKSKPVVVKEKSAVVIKAPIAPAVEEEDAITKEEIIKALDSLAKLKTEQERIVNYLTKRINKKPILIYTEADSVNVEIYDSGIHDKDSVSIIYNNRLVVDRQELNVKSPIKFKLRVSSNPSNNQLVFVAENLGFDPPNTAVMIITDKFGKRQEVILNTDLTHNEVVVFLRIVKK